MSVLFGWIIVVVGLLLLRFLVFKTLSSSTESRRAATASDVASLNERGLSVCGDVRKATSGSSAPPAQSSSPEVKVA